MFTMATARRLISVVSSSFLSHQHCYPCFGVALPVVALRPMAVDDNNNDNNYYSGQENQIFQRALRRETRVAILEELNEQRTQSQDAELLGLREKVARFEEQYDPSLFSTEHQTFKRMHNSAFLSLARYCQRKTMLLTNNSNNSNNPMTSTINLFFLDGPDAGTAHVVTEFFDVKQCFVANRHKSTCNALCQWGLPLENVAHASAAEALQDRDGAFGHCNFGAYYFDACGGYAPMIIEMLNAALGDEGQQQQQFSRSGPIAIGFSLLGGNRDVMDKEVAIVQHLVVLARALNLHVHHVLDDPSQYGVDPNLRKVQGGTMTSWFILESS